MPYRKKGSSKGKWQTQRTKYAGKGNPNYKGANLKCATCGKPIHKPPSVIKKTLNKGNYCSQKCYWNSKLHHRSRKVLPDILCAWCGKAFSPRGSKSKFCGRKCFEAWYSKNHNGAKHHSWKGGPSLYPPEWNDALRARIRKRDNYTCQDCGKVIKPRDRKNRSHQYRLHVHHIDRNKNNLSDSNLVSLCVQCHLKRHGWHHST